MTTVFQDDAAASAAPYVPVVVGREVRHTTFETPTGPRSGYQLRFELEAPGSESSIFTEWLHLPDPLMLHLTESLDAFMRSEGHLRTTQP